MKNLTQFKLLYIFFVAIAFLDIAYGDKCSAPTSESGPCVAHHHRFTYSSVYRNCMFFVYGGCGATKNIFKTYAECKSACVPKE